MNHQHSSKTDIHEIAMFGGPRLFSTPKPVSNLAKPDFDTFLNYLAPAYHRGQLTGGGSVVKLLEIHLATFHGVPYCVTFNSGFWALAAVMKTLALPGRDEVVMPSLTYRRMADIAGWAGLKPNFCEVDYVSMTNTAECVRPCINTQTAMVMGVHPINGLADIDGLTKLTAKQGLPLVFDSVESVYESHNGQRIGSFGLAEVFSLGASKLINGFEGGYVTTHSLEVAQKLHASLSPPIVAAEYPGFVFNGILSEIHAAMALACLDDIDKQIMRNRAKYLAYKKLLHDMKGIRLLDFNEADRPGYKNIIAEITTDWPFSRDETVQLMNAEMILARAYYPQPLHTRRMGYPHVPCQLPITEDLATRYILLPCGELVTHADIAAICEFLSFINQHGKSIRNQLKEQEPR